MPPTRPDRETKKTERPSRQVKATSQGDQNQRILNADAPVPLVFERLQYALTSLPSENRPFLWDRYISFNKGRSRDSWEGLFMESEWPYMSHPSEFRKAKVGKRNNVFVTLCCWKPVPYVSECELGENNEPKYASTEWHITALAIIKDAQSRRHLIFFDVDRDPQRTRRSKILSPPLWKLCQAECMTKNELWVNKVHFARGESFCLEYGVRQVEKWLSFGDLLWQGADDPRLKEGEWENIVKT